jgi:hypothetical protein
VDPIIKAVPTGILSWEEVVQPQQESVSILPPTMLLMPLKVTALLYKALAILHLRSFNQTALAQD